MTLAEDRFVTDVLWERLRPLIPPRKPAINGRTGQPRVPDLEGVLRNRVHLVDRDPLEKLPSELGYGYGSGITCWRRMREWQDAGVWDQLRKVVLDELGQAGMIDWSRACLDSVSVRAKKGAISLDLRPRTGASSAPSITS